ncbi:MAG: TIGR00730 family Rossman fold protein [Clostridiales bacterium]|nr:TIGR00730 family Rossman fold protein [Clostridiales bacterium]
MKICIFGAASNDINPHYIDMVERLGAELGGAGHELIFGAGANGLMGASARGFKKGGGKITGVIPSFFRDESIEAIYGECDELIFTESMRDRKKLMEDASDSFIIVPGGIGTFEEFYEVLTLKQLKRHEKPIALYNIDGYFNNLMAFMEHCTDEGFIKRGCSDLYICTEDCDRMLEYLEHSKPLDYTLRDLKNG